MHLSKHVSHICEVLVEQRWRIPASESICVIAEGTSKCATKRDAFFRESLVGACNPLINFLPVPSSVFLDYRSSAALGCATRHPAYGRKGPGSAAAYRYREVQLHKEDWSELRRIDVAPPFPVLAWHTALHRQGEQFDCFVQSTSAPGLAVLGRSSRGLMTKREAPRVLARAGCRGSGCRSGRCRGRRRGRGGRRSAAPAAGAGTSAPALDCALLQALPR